MDVARPRTVRSLCVLTFVCDVICDNVPVHVTQVPRSVQLLAHMTLASQWTP